MKASIQKFPFLQILLFSGVVVALHACQSNAKPQEDSSQLLNQELTAEGDGLSSEHWTIDAKATINGVCFVAPSKPIDSSSFGHLNKVGATWVCLMPYAYCPANEAKVVWNTKWQWWGEKDQGLEETIRLAKAKNKRVMVKPHIWRRHGAFTGDMDFESDEDWAKWEADYEAYVLKCAEISEKHKADIFCLGTELKNPIKVRPEYWRELITKIRKKYSGEVTYAANWDNFQNIPFWEELDYIGMDAYFPLSDKQNPSVQELLAGWANHKKQIHQLSKEVQKPVIFPEYGYRSIEYTGKEPWESNVSHPINHEAQINAYKAIYEAFWKEEWFKGGFIWKWYDYHEKIPTENNGFTPQNKPVSAIIKECYSSNAHNASH